MNCKTITERLKRVAAIVDSWKVESGVPQIERDIALGELRAIYDELLVVDVENLDSEESVDFVADTEQEIEVEVVIEEAPIEEIPIGEREEETEEEREEETASISDVASMESFYNALDIDALLGLNDEPEAEQPAENVKASAPVVEELTPEPASEVVVKVVAPVVEDPTPEPAPTPEPIAEPTPEEPKPMGAGLFDLNDIPVRSKSRRKMISLYSDNPLPAQNVAEPESKVVENTQATEVAKSEEAVPVAESTPEPTTAAPQMRLGDTFGGVKTLADQMAKDDVATTPFNRITELRQAIGLNDKFLMIRDLFGGDAARYEATIDTLDEFEDLDECIIYIVENFRWNPDLEAAKLLVSLIERKLA